MLFSSPLLPIMKKFVWMPFFTRNLNLFFEAHSVKYFLTVCSVRISVFFFRYRTSQSAGAGWRPL
jgi:hypothetical protein